MKDANKMGFHVSFIFDKAQILWFIVLSNIAVFVTFLLG